jgi:Fe-S cluster assembly ATP-binding protein
VSSALSIRNLQAWVGDRQILVGLDLEVPFGEMHAVMGPNGSGKSTLCHVLSGKAGYRVEGEALLSGADLLTRPVDERARMGLLQAFQYPVEVPGVRLGELLLEAAEEQPAGKDGLTERLALLRTRLDMGRVLERAVNDDLSGGEKKRSELFQLQVLGPQVALLDELDSGLDIDAVREVAEAVEAMRSPQLGILMITHYSRILRFVIPDRVHVLLDGRIVESGGPELAHELEAGGYEAIRNRHGMTPPKQAPVEKPAAEFFTDTPFDV